MVVIIHNANTFKRGIIIHAYQKVSERYFIAAVALGVHTQSHKQQNTTQYYLFHYLVYLFVKNKHLPKPNKIL